MRTLRWRSNLVFCPKTHDRSSRAGGWKPGDHGECFGRRRRGERESASGVSGGKQAFASGALLVRRCAVSCQAASSAAAMRALRSARVEKAPLRDASGHGPDGLLGERRQTSHELPTHDKAGKQDDKGNESINVLIDWPRGRIAVYAHGGFDKGDGGTGAGSHLDSVLFPSTGPWKRRCLRSAVSPRSRVDAGRTRTLHVGDALQQDLLQQLGALELLLHLGDDGRGQLPLLALLDLALVAHPRVQDGLGLGGEGRLLLDLEGLGLEPGGFLAGGCGCERGRASSARAGLKGLLLTLDTSKRLLVMPTTPLICLTSSMRLLTASLWSARALTRMFRILSMWPWAHAE